MLLQKVIYHFVALESKLYPRISPVVKNAQEVLCFDITGEECRPQKVSISLFIDVTCAVVLNQCHVCCVLPWCRIHGHIFK